MADHLAKPLLSSSPSMNARAAFELKNIDESIKFHEHESAKKLMRLSTANSQMDDQDLQLRLPSSDGYSHTEPTLSEGRFLRPFIFGGLDGLGTTFALIAGSVGAQIQFTGLLAICAAQILAGSVAMGLGEYLSNKAEEDVARREQRREHWEVENFPQGEINEMICIYMEKGKMTYDDAKLVADTLSKYKDFWVDHMLLTEIGIQPPEDDDCWISRPVMSAIAMFTSFTLFGVLPLIAYGASVIAVRGVIQSDANDWFGFVACSLVSVSLLFLLGVIKAGMSDLPRFYTGSLMVLQGVFASGLSYYVGAELPDLITSWFS